MVITQTRPRRTVRGARYRAYRKKRLYELGREPSMTKLAPKKMRIIRTKGGNLKARLLTADIANLFDPKTKRYEQAKIKTITDNPANRHFIRRNIMTKGAVIETEKGKARITSRPGQDGTVNAVLIG